MAQPTAERVPSRGASINCRFASARAGVVCERHSVSLHTASGQNLSGRCGVYYGRGRWWCAVPRRPGKISDTRVQHLQPSACHSIFIWAVNFRWVSAVVAWNEAEELRRDALGKEVALSPFRERERKVR